MITRLPSDFRTARKLVGTLAMALFALVVLTGCDSTGGLDDSDDETVVTAEETAESIATAVSEDTGGTLSDLSDAAGFLQTGVSSNQTANQTAKVFTQENNCSYSTETRVWLCSVAVNGSNARIDTASFEREYRLQFFSGETTIRRPADADSMTFGVVSGRGELVTTSVDNSHDLLPTTWSLARTGDGTLRVELLSAPAGRNANETFTGNIRQRIRNAEVRKTRADGLVVREGSGVIAGTLEGTYDATVDITRADDSVVTRTINAEYVITFTDSGAEITFTGGIERFNGESFSFDRTTGVVR